MVYPVAAVIRQTGLGASHQTHTQFHKKLLIFLFFVFVSIPTPTYTSFPRNTSTLNHADFTKSISYGHSINSVNNCSARSYPFRHSFIASSQAPASPSPRAPTISSDIFVSHSIRTGRGLSFSFSKNIYNYGKSEWEHSNIKSSNHRAKSTY